MEAVATLSFFVLVFIGLVAVVKRRYSLRPFREDDRERVFLWRNSDFVAGSSFTRNISWEDHSRWFDEQLLGRGRHNYVFEHNDTPAGVIAHDPDPRSGVSVFGMYLGRGGVPLGGKMLGLLTLESGFAVLKAGKILGKVLGSNERALRLYAFLNYEVEDVLRGGAIVDGRREDVVLVCMLAERWAEIRESVIKKIVGVEVGYEICYDDGDSTTTFYKN